MRRLLPGFAGGARSAPVLTLLALAAIAAVAAVGWSFWEGARAGRDPILVTRIAPEELSPPARRLDFEPIETALAKAERDAAGNLVLTADIGLALEAAAAALPTHLPPETMERIRVLIRKGAPGKAGEQLAALFAEYRRYREIEQRVLGAAQPDDLDAEIERFERSVALRREHFGEARAKRLFGRQEALLGHILQLRRVEADPGLSDAEKEARQRALQREYERRIQGVSD